MSKRGLPVTLKMRHDAHYVEALTSSAGSPIGRLVPIDRIDPIPNKQGSPGIFADAQFGVYFDNLKVTPNQ